LGGGCGFNRRRGQNSMVMGEYSKEQPTRRASVGEEGKSGDGFVSPIPSGP
jgi:hypothetical protein